MKSTTSHAWRSRSATFIALWIIANATGGFLVGFLENNGLQFAATIGLTGAVVGSLQWMVLRYVRMSPIVYGLGWWPLLSALGWTLTIVALSTGQSLYHEEIAALSSQLNFPEAFWSVVTWMLWVLGMAIAQSRLLQSRFLLAWLLASSAGSLVQILAARSLCSAICPVLPSALFSLIDAAGWAIYGAATGLILLSFQAKLSQERYQ
ncbi:MAG: hypothetical protein WBD47_15405 [Phormidesmis sp.]